MTGLKMDLKPLSQGVRLNISDILVILVLISTLLTQVKIPYSSYAVHNILIPFFCILLIILHHDKIKGVIDANRAIFVIMTFLYLWMWISAYSSDYPSTALKYCLKYSFYPVIFIAFLLHGYDNTTNKTYRIIFYFLIMLGLFGIVEAANPYLRIFQMMRPQGDFLPRVASLMQNPNPFGVLMSLGVVLTVLLKKYGKISRFEFLAATLLFIVSIVLSGSRNAMVTVVMGIIILFIYRIITPNRKMLLAGIGICVSAAVLTVGVLTYEYPGALRDTTEHLLKGNIESRMLLYREAIAQIAQHPVAGVGIEVFSKHIAVQFTGDDGLHTHNIILQLFAELGIVGLSLSIVLAFFLIRNANYRNPLIAAPLLVILSAQIFDFLFHDYTFPATAFMIAAIAANSKTHDNNEKSPLAV